LRSVKPQVNPKFIYFEAYIKFLKNTSRHNKVKKTKTKAGYNCVFYVIDQNVNKFRGFVQHRPYFRRFSKNPFKNPLA